MKEGARRSLIPKLDHMIKVISRKSLMNHDLIRLKSICTVLQFVRVSIPSASHILQGLD